MCRRSRATPRLLAKKYGSTNKNSLGKNKESCFSGILVLVNMGKGDTKNHQSAEFRA